MNKDLVRQITNVVAVITTIGFNILANALPLNGQNTGAISDRFRVFFVPAGYVFAIWGLIYIGMIAFGTYQALPSQRANPRLRRVGYLFALSYLANIAWLFCWHYNAFALSVIVMLCAAALELAYAGRRVTLVESRPRLGGLGFSFRRGELTVDNGQHVHLRCCTAYRRLLDRIGGSALAPLQQRLDVPVLDVGHASGPRLGRLRRTALPVPLHLAGSLAGYPHLSLAENLFLGALPRRGWRVDWRRAHGEAERILGAAGLALDPRCAAGACTVAVQQMVCLLRAADRSARVLVLDEPTSSLDRHEAERVLALAVAPAPVAVHDGVFR